MDAKADKPEEKPAKQPEPPDGRGDRPEDPNELAKWIVEQTTSDSEKLADERQPEPPS